MPDENCLDQRGALPWWRRIFRRKPLTAELLALKLENARLRQELRFYRRGADWARRISGTVAMGPGLANALENWAQAYGQSNKWPWWRRIPRSQTIDLVGAYLRRRAMSGIFIAAVASVPAFVTLVLLWQQNKKIDQQIHLSLSAQATQLLERVNSVTTEVQNASGGLCLTRQAVEKAHKTYGNVTGNVIIDEGVAESIRLKTFPLCWRDANRTQFERLWVLAFNGTGPKERFVAPLPTTVETEARNVSRLLRPYRTLIDADSSGTPTLSERTKSVERGQILEALVNNRFAVRDFQLAGVWLPDGELYLMQISRSDLSGAVLSCSRILEANFDEVTLRGADFSGSILSNSDFSTSRLIRVDFNFAVLFGVRLPPADYVFESRFDEADLDGAIVTESGFYSTVTSVPSEQDPYSYIKLDEGSAYEMKLKVSKDILSTDLRRREYCANQTANHFEPIRGTWSPHLSGKWWRQ